MALPTRSLAVHIGSVANIDVFHRTARPALTAKSTSDGRAPAVWPRVLGYVALAYGISWACWLPLVFGGAVVDVGGWPTHLPGLIGPLLAAIVVASLVSRWRAYRMRLTEWRIGWWWLVAVSPLAMLAAAVLAHSATGGATPAWSDFGRMNGFPLWGPVAVAALLVVVNGLGEEGGWRGFLQPTLQARMRPLFAIAVVAVVWATWHLPLFAVLATYRGFTIVTAVGFFFGMLCGAVVLGWLYNRTGSVAAVAVWHGLFNVASATAAAHGTVAAVVTTIVMAQAVVLVVADLVTRGRVLAPTRRSS
jgi:membrane protease YdiL (CAAX protease family)